MFEGLNIREMMCPFQEITVNHVKNENHTNLFENHEISLHTQVNHTKSIKNHRKSLKTYAKYTESLESHEKSLETHVNHGESFENHKPFENHEKSYDNDNLLRII